MKYKVDAPHLSTDCPKTQDITNVLSIGTNLQVGGAVSCKNEQCKMEANTHNTHCIQNIKLKGWIGKEVSRYYH